ncbi:response regulator [Acidaminobacter sp. JC074]|uniref:response regulator n=1 Tax=Acidaminobacter sp. JC074 TaxID=2530199 RepID=UPI001F0D7CBC|nr:response regulator [Acidaminobacter sp. JC074]
MTKQIIIVDDERTVLRNFEKLLKKEPYKVTCFNKGHDALEYMANQNVDMIISDVAMPEMDGETLLATVKADHPKVIRVALSHLNENKRITRLIERGLATQYLFKPWNNYEMKLSIKNILEMNVYLMDEENLGKINNLEELPSLPSLYMELTDLLDKDADMDDVAELISRDQAITSKILKMVNSAFYGRKTGNIIQAMMTLGLNNVKNIVLTNSFFTTSSDSMDKLWQHTMDTNRLCLALYEKCLNKRMPSLFGSAGLLHDVGRVILYMFHNDDYNDLIKEAESTEYTLVNLELENFHTTHQDIGAYLLNSWGLPYAYVEAAMFHHRPMDERVINKELVSVVHLADYYATKVLSPDGTHNLLDQSVFDFLNVTREQVERVVESMK